MAADRRNLEMHFLSIKENPVVICFAIECMLSGSTKVFT